MDIDLDAILAAEDEAEGDAHKVTWGGQVFNIPRATAWPVETLDVLTQGRFADALALILGDEWDRFWQAKRPTLGTSKALINALVSAEGFDGLGGSSASSPSPNRAMRRSKPTSSATTA